MTAKVKERPKAREAYEGDFHQWLTEQAGFLRGGLLTEVDAQNVAEELEGLARSELSKLVSALRVLLAHMLKWDQQIGHRSKSWIFSIREQRDRYADLVEDNPSFKSKRDLALKRAYRGARRDAARETDLPEETFPDDCPYAWDDILSRAFNLDSTPRP